MADDLDSVARYAKTLGLAVKRRTVLVEGTTDVSLFQLAARFEREMSGQDLIGDQLAIVAAGVGDQGGTNGVVRELLALRGMSRTCLLPDGRPHYRFVGLFDNDPAGQRAVKLMQQLDSSILEYKDVFRLWPIMPLTGSLDPMTLKKVFEKHNQSYRGLHWELEDLLPAGFFAAFVSEHPTAVTHETCVSGKVHRDLTRDGKAKLHRYIKQYAMCDDLRAAIEVLRALRYYLNIR